MKRYIYFLLLLSPFLCIRCELNQKDYDPEGDFIKIYNDSDVDKKYYPAGIKQVDDGGYLVVSGVKYEEDDSELPLTEVFKTNSLGRLEWRTSFEDLRAPANGLIHTAQFSGFIAMAGNELNGYLITLDLETGNETNRFDLDIKFPLAFYQSETSIAVLGYNSDDRTSDFNVYDASNLNLQHSTSLNINKDVEISILEHLNKLGDQLPFFIGEWTEGGKQAYFANCYDNYSLRLVLFNSGHNKDKDVFVYQDNGAISSFLFKGENSYALTLFYNDDNFLHPDTSLNSAGSQQFNKTMGLPLPELTPKAKVYANQHFNGNDSTLVFISSTNKNSIHVYQFEYNGDKLIRQFEMGFEDDISISSAVQTKDMGYAVLARIFVTGKYPRPVILKIPPHKFRDEK